MQQHDLVSQRLNFTCPPVSAPAGFECNQPGRALSQKRDQIVTAEPPIRNLAGLSVDPVQLEHPLTVVNFKMQQPLKNSRQASDGNGRRGAYLNLISHDQSPRAGGPSVRVASSGSIADGIAPGSSITTGR
jgi:hypothetical protein